MFRCHFWLYYFGLWVHTDDDVGGGGGGGGGAVNYGDGSDGENDNDCRITQILSSCQDWTPNHIPLGPGSLVEWYNSGIRTN